MEDAGPAAHQYLSRELKSALDGALWDREHSCDSYGPSLASSSHENTVASYPPVGPGTFIPGASKSEDTLKTTSGCRDGEVEAQRRRKANYSQLVVAELRLRDSQDPAFSSSQSPGSHGHRLPPPLHPTPLQLQSTDIEAYIQHPIPSQP